jgi:hypothetical protein
VPTTLLDPSSLAGAMLAMSAARLSGTIQVAGDQHSGQVWLREGDVTYAALANEQDTGGEDLDDPVFRAHHAIVHTLGGLFMNQVMTIHLRKAASAGSDDDPRFDTVHLLRLFDESPGHQPA